jgi:nucleoside-diphosphate-sugar epimerase
MKIILTGATGVLGSHIMYEILELFLQNSDTTNKLYIIARDNGKNSAENRINELLSSYYTPKVLLNVGLHDLNKFVEIVREHEVTNSSFVETIKGAYLIHSAGYVSPRRFFRFYILILKNSFTSAPLFRQELEEV